MNEHKPVKISRDGQEIPNAAGREICMRIDELQWAADPKAYIEDGDEPETGGPGRMDLRQEMPRRRRIRRSEAEVPSAEVPVAPHSETPRRRWHKQTESGDLPVDLVAEDPRGELRRRQRADDSLPGAPQPKSRPRAIVVPGSTDDVTPLRRRRRHVEDLDEPSTVPQWPGLERAQQIESIQGERRRKRDMLSQDDARERIRKRPECSPAQESLIKPIEAKGTVGDAQKRERVGAVKKKRRKILNGAADSVKEGPMLPVSALQLQESDRKELERGISLRISQVPDLPQEEGTFDMLAEYVVCLLLSGKRPREVESEVTGFLEDHATEFLGWLASYLEDFLQARNLLSGKKTKADSELSVEPKPEASEETQTELVKDTSDAHEQVAETSQPPKPEAESEANSSLPNVVPDPEPAANSEADQTKANDDELKAVEIEAGEQEATAKKDKNEAKDDEKEAEDNAAESPVGSADAESPDFQGDEEQQEVANPSDGEPEPKKAAEPAVSDLVVEATEKGNDP